MLPHVQHQTALEKPCIKCNYNLISLKTKLPNIISSLVLASVNCLLQLDLVNSKLWKPCWMRNPVSWRSMGILYTKWKILTYILVFHNHQETNQLTLLNTESRKDKTWDTNCKTPPKIAYRVLALWVIGKCFCLITNRAFYTDLTPCQSTSMTWISLK